MRYRQSLPLGERHFVGRLESFGDIVVGFSMSQLALQLEIPKTPHDVFAHPFGYFIFFIAFAVVSVFWFRFHRIMSTGFAPHRPDVVLLFAFLAFVALIPYALVTYMRLRGPDGYSPEGVMLYLSVFLGLVTFSWVLTLRGMRRAWGYLDGKQRRDTWRAIVAGGIGIPIFAAAVLVVAVLGTRGFSALIVLGLAIPLATRILRQPWPRLVGPQAELAPGTLAAAEVS